MPLNKFFYRIRALLRALFLMSVARLLGYNGAEFVDGYEGVHPALTPVFIDIDVQGKCHFVRPSAKACDEARQ